MAVFSANEIRTFILEYTYNIGMFHRHYPYKRMISKNWNFMQHGKNQGLSDQIFRRHRFKKGTQQHVVSNAA